MLKLDSNDCILPLPMPEKGQHLKVSKGTMQNNPTPIDATSIFLISCDSLLGNAFQHYCVHHCVTV